MGPKWANRPTNQNDLAKTNPRTFEKLVNDKGETSTRKQSLIQHIMLEQLMKN